MSARTGKISGLIFDCFEGFLLETEDGGRGSSPASGTRRTWPSAHGASVCASPSGARTTSRIAL
jgi:hypothetical protein